MSANASGAQAGISNAQLWAGHIISAVAWIFMLVDGVMKLVKPPVVVKATTQLGYAETVISGIGVTLLICTIVYMVPRSAPVGAVLLTGYLGGAVASNLRAGEPMFNLVFPILMGAFVWGGLWLRDERVRGMLLG